jgi:hypothetical protein
MRNCPVCDSDKLDIVHNQRFILQEGHPLPNVYNVVTCSKCSFIFADVNATSDTYNKYYTEWSNYENSILSTGSGLNLTDEKRLECTVEFLTKLVLNKNSAILDLGASQGGTLNIFKEKGYTNLSAIESSKYCCSIMNKVGIKTVIPEKQKFDLIILSHVMEHIYDLNEIFNLFNNLLSETGIIYVEVPDSDRYTEFYKKPYHYFDLEHINHFNKFTLNNLFGKNGYENVSSDKKIVEIVDGELYPAIFHVFRKYKPNIQYYINKSFDNEIGYIFEKYISEQTPVAIYGVGAFLSRLLAMTNLKQCNIQFIIDENPNKQGTTILGHVIACPDVLNNFSGVIFVTVSLGEENVITKLKKYNCIKIC